MEQENKSSPKVAVVYYSMYGHVKKLAEQVAKGVEEEGVTPKIFQIAETLSDEILQKMHAPPKADHPAVTPMDLVDYDAILFGIPTRFGSMPAQCKAFWDATGQIWAKQLYVGKLISFFFSTGTQGGGQETTALTAYTQAVHHGMLIVPVGYTCPLQFNMDEMHGGSAYGAGTFAGADGSRQPTELELKLAHHQGKLVTGYAKKFMFGKSKM